MACTPPYEDVILLHGLARERNRFTEDPTHVEGQTGNRTLWSGQGCPHRRDGVSERTRQFGENSPISPPSPPQKKKIAENLRIKRKTGASHNWAAPLENTNFLYPTEVCAKCAQVRGSARNHFKVRAACGKVCASARNHFKVRAARARCARKVRGSVRNSVLTTACLKSRSGGSV